MMRLKPKQYFIELLNKLYDGSITKKELEKLSYFFHNNQELKSWPEHFGSKTEIEERIFSRLQSDIHKESSKEIRVIPLYKKAIFKYSVAASVVFLISLTYFFNRNNSTPSIVSPTIVEENIKPGTDKATLTLEDGSVIELDKSQMYQNKNVRSNGSQIVYETNDEATNEIVYNYLTIPRGGEYHIILSDGTQVWLNSESQLKYPVSFIEGEVRQVELVYGEAYFDVSSNIDHNGTKFIVNNQSQKIEVLGTEFNIKANKNEMNIYTTLVEGEVIINAIGSKQKLLPNQQSNLDIENKNVTIADVDVIPEISWKNGLFIFRNKSLKEIMRVIERWYDVDIVFVNKDLESVKFRGVIKKQVSIEEILTIMKSSSINSYDINNRTIILK
ncbi:FecR family protein [Flavivirga spongiicola]|uniref:FecR family protein n=1 Tax=Flavivirga spongiicola TaxID=421621 RepID=A0ABU7XWN7_9FLAO|nr:FecR family protein [Flavivirga sp. MEBiC05379]MDO5980184.1 FecR family protein [Flavivirga sp. MEBiC05379]